MHTDVGGKLAECTWGGVGAKRDGEGLAAPKTDREGCATYTQNFLQLSDGIKMTNYFNNPRPFSLKLHCTSLNLFQKLKTTK